MYRSLGAAAAGRGCRPPTREIRQRWGELVARIMPFDLVIDEHTADGQEARVSKTSVAGSWGAVAGSLRYFADRFGTPRAAIEGTTLPYDLIREHATWGPPAVRVGGPRKHQRLVVSRMLTYFGFELETVTEVLEVDIPAALRDLALAALADALVAGETVHPDQARIRRAIAELDELWRRSGGTLAQAGREHVRSIIRRELEGVAGWQVFLGTRLALDPAALVDADTRASLGELPSSARIKGDTVALEYDVEAGEPVVRMLLREGQARRLRPGDLPPLDRPLRFEVARGRHPPLRAGSLGALHEELRRVPKQDGRGRRRRRV